MFEHHTVPDELVDKTRMLGIGGIDHFEGLQLRLRDSEGCAGTTFDEDRHVVFLFVNAVFQDTGN
jgi:hypothetical protein